VDRQIAAARRASEAARAESQSAGQG
jgi:hypothetical protein